MLSTLRPPARVARPVQSAPAYQARLARTASDLRAAQALRFDVFNVELDEGLVRSFDTGLDADAFDEVCDHLLVEDAASGEIVGTYRLQTGVRAGATLGYYSEREFDFGPFDGHRAQIVELGRACIDARHRNFAVLNLLWKGIGVYAREHGARYLIGCSSLPTTDMAEGAAAHQRLLAHQAPVAWRTRPLPGVACDLGVAAGKAPPIPRLLSAYLAYGAAICGPPAVDREFRTIDFLTWIDIDGPAIAAMQARGRFTT